MAEAHIVIAGGGGQQLRTALALSCCAGRAFRLARFREAEAHPGLRPPHLAAVAAAAALCDAEVEGAAPGSSELCFAPRRAAHAVEGLELQAGEGGAVGHLLQVVCWPLALAPGASTLTLRGATHLDGAPGFHELALAWAPAAARLGFKLALSLGQAGFAGGDGELFVRVEPAHAMPPLDLRHRGLLQEVRVLALTGHTAPEAGHGLAERAVRGLRRLGVAAEAEGMALPSPGGRGAQVLVLARFERSLTAHAALAGPPAGRVGPGGAEAVVAAFGEQLLSGGAIDAHLGDQLLLPAGLVAGRLVAPAEGVVPVARWSVGRVTRHLLAGAALLPRFLDVTATVFGREGEPGEVRVAPADASPDVLPLRREDAPASPG